jgi:anti-sigma28 factor (negative regulator of flagellin synthesis)
MAEVTEAMKITNGDTTGVLATNVNRPLGPRDVNSANPFQSVAKPTKPVDDTVAFSEAANFVQQTSSAGEQSRLARILQLKTAIEKNQYSVDPLAVSHAVIKAALLGN